MRNVIRYKNDILLNQSALEDFVAQVGPAPFKPSFSFGKEIQAYMAKHNAAKTYAIKLNGNSVFRPHLDTYEARPKVHGTFNNVEFFEIQGLSAETDAIGWILHSDYLGAIPNRHGLKGIRIRVGNIQIGDSRVLDQAFPEARFNAWAVGECHVLSSKLIPNARRDDFEQSTHYSHLLGHLVPKAKQIAKACRDRSAERTRQRKEAAARNNANGKMVDWVKAKAFLSKNAHKHLNATHKSEIKKMLRSDPPTYADLVRLLVGAPAAPKKDQK
jgi:molecular chaperone HtpG